MRPSHYPVASHGPSRKGVTDTPLLATDRRIGRRRAPRVIGAALVSIAVLAGGALYLNIRKSASVLAIPLARVTIGAVIVGPLVEDMPFRGHIAPQDSVRLDMVQDGRVEDIYEKAGNRVAAGAPLFRTSNPTLELAITAQETAAIDHINSQNALRLNALQTARLAAEQKAEADYKVVQLTRLHDNQRRLTSRQSGSLADLQKLDEDLAYWRDLQRIRSDAAQKVGRQVSQIEASIAHTSRRLDESMAAGRKQLDRLTVRAPISGYLTGLDIVPGQRLATGAHVGQIDDDTAFKVEATIDEFYLGRVKAGQEVAGAIGPEPVTLTIARIFPRITDGKFLVEAMFLAPPPTPVTRGQAIEGRLKLAEAGGDVVQAPRGAWLASTGGNWAYVVDSKGAARRQSITTGRRTGDALEIVSGLKGGDRMITSSYENFGDYQELNLTN